MWEAEEEVQDEKPGEGGGRSQPTAPGSFKGPASLGASRPAWVEARVALRQVLGPVFGLQLSSVSRSRYPVLRTRLYLMGISIHSLSHSFTCLFLCLFNKYLLSTYYVPGLCWELRGDRNDF